MRETHTHAVNALKIQCVFTPKLDVILRERRIMSRDICLKCFLMIYRRTLEIFTILNPENTSILFAENILCLTNYGKIVINNKSTFKRI